MTLAADDFDAVWYAKEANGANSASKSVRLRRGARSARCCASGTAACSAASLVGRRRRRLGDSMC